MSQRIHVWSGIRTLVPQGLELNPLVTDLLRYRPLAETIQLFWSTPAHRRTSTWTDHRDINMVMLATSLAPKGYF